MTRSQLTLYLENKPGQLARACHALTAANVNIEGISVVHTTDVSMVQIIVGDARTASQALHKAGIPITEQKVAVINLPNKAGALAAIASRLAEKSININYLYATAPPESAPGECSVVISADDLAAVEAAWRA